MKSNIMKKTIYLSAFAFAVTTSLVGCGDPLLDDLDTNIEVSTGDLSIAENYEQAAGMFLTAQQKNARCWSIERCTHLSSAIQHSHRQLCRLHGGYPELRW